MNKIEQRQALVSEARSWVGTPYHHMGAVKGAGCDCAQLIKQCFMGCGLVEDFPVPQYTRDWHLHRSEENYLSYVERYLHRRDHQEQSLDAHSRDSAFKVDSGDIIMFRVGRCFSHSAIVTEWPLAVHASFPSGCVEEVRLLNTPMSRRLCRIYSYWSAP